MAKHKFVLLRRIAGNPFPIAIDVSLLMTNLRNIKKCQVRFNLKYICLLSVFLCPVSRPRMSYEPFRKVRISKIRYRGFCKSYKIIGFQSSLSSTPERSSDFANDLLKSRYRNSGFDVSYFDKLQTPVTIV